MFRYDKDMERVMLEKKKEVLREMETAKERILRELYCLKRTVHTDFCGMIAEYNRINCSIQKTFEDCKKSLKDAVDGYTNLLAETIENYNIEINAKLEFINQREQEITDTVNAKLAELEDLATAVQTATDNLNSFMGESEQEMTALIESTQATIAELIANAPTKEDLDNAVAELKEVVTQADWSVSDPENMAYVKNRTHYKIADEYIKIYYTITADVSTSQTPETYTKAPLYDPSIEIVRFAIGENNNGVFGDVIFYDSGPLTLDYSGFDPETSESPFTIYENTFENGDYIHVYLKFNEYRGGAWDYGFNTALHKNYNTSGSLVLAGLNGYRMVTKTLDPFYLAYEPKKGCYLRMVNDALMEWDDLIVVSPNGTQYKLTVADDGTLSATAVATTTE